MGRKGGALREADPALSSPHHGENIPIHGRAGWALCPVQWAPSRHLGMAWDVPRAGTQLGPCRASVGCHQPEGAAPGQGCGWVGEGGHRHPLLTAGSQQLVQDRQSVQADLEHQVGKEEEDAGRQQSFEDAAGVTCDTRAELSPSSQGHPNRHPAPSGRAGKGAHCAQRFQGSAPRLGSHQGFVHPAQPQGTPRAKAQDHPPCLCSAHLAPPWPCWAGTTPGCSQHPYPCWNIPWEPPKRIPLTPNPVSPSTSCSRAPIPPGSPGPVPVFLARGGMGSLPTTAASRPGGGPGPTAFPPLFFPVNPRESSRQQQQQRRDPGQ